MFMNTLSIENQNISGKVGFEYALRDVRSSECVNRLLTRNSQVQMCLLLKHHFFCNILVIMVLLQEIVYMCSIKSTPRTSQYTCI